MSDHRTPPPRRGQRRRLAPKRYRPLPGDIRDIAVTEEANDNHFAAAVLRCVATELERLTIEIGLIKIALSAGDTAEAYQLVSQIDLP
jgi:hypothetical protein